MSVILPPRCSPTFFKLVKANRYEIFKIIPFRYNNINKCDSEIARLTNRVHLSSVGPDGITDHQVTVIDRKYVGIGTMSPEGTSDLNYLWRATKVRTGEISLSINKLRFKECPINSALI